ncbi:hypothetical protein L1987_03593 [Smallanthus sonchifolius]|uniref:Uncharacterized protein n=1 Tax=Smallanthus sonchifolius TaxID=185202 RepID=A0ACB9KB50_9ASTR|nr:hypothetical protein L1987_03593 [Smallanthus sonchifolius]
MIIVGQVSPGGKCHVASTTPVSVDVEVVSDSDEEDSQPLSSFKRRRSELLVSLVPLSSAQRTNVIHVSVPKVGKLSCSLSKAESTSVDVGTSFVDYSHLSSPFIVSLGSGLDLGASTDPSLNSVPSFCVPSCVSFLEDYPLMSYPTWSTSMISLISVSETLPLFDHTGHVPLSSGVSSAAFPPSGSLLENSDLARGFLGRVFPEITRIPSVSLSSSSITGQFCLSIANDFIMGASLYRQVASLEQSAARHAEAFKQELVGVKLQKLDLLKDMAFLTQENASLEHQHTMKALALKEPRVKLLVYPRN